MLPIFTPQLLDDAQSETSQYGDPGRPGRNALSLEDGVGATLDQREPDLSTTRTALPIGTGGDTAPAGRQGPQPPETPEFPRLDVPTDAPERDEDARRQDRIMALLGALGATAAAAGDDPVALNVAGGLAKGASQDLQRRKQSFAKRQQAFQEMVTEAEKFNRRQKQREVEAQFERDLSRFEQAQQNRRQRAKANQQRIQSQREAERERQQAEREQERTLEQIRARGRQRRLTAATRNNADDTGEEPEPRDLENFTVPRDPERAQSLLNQVNQEIGALERRRDDFVTREINARGQTVESLDDEYLDQMSRLRRQKAALQASVEQGGRGGQDRGAPPRVGEGRRRQGSTLPGGGEPSGDRSRRQRRIGAGEEGFSSDTTSAGTQSGQGQRTGSQNNGQGAPQNRGYADRVNRVLQNRGRRAALDTLAQDLEEGRISPREAQAYYEQIAPDSLLQR
jgi:hypothetical protein